jgi:hypothetical protein
VIALENAINCHENMAIATCNDGLNFVRSVWMRRKDEQPLRLKPPAHCATFPDCTALTPLL